QLMQTGERQLHLGLHARGTQEPERRCSRAQVVEEGGLPNAGLASDDENLSLPRPDTAQQRVDRLALASSPQQGCAVPRIRHLVSKPGSTTEEVAFRVGLLMADVLTIPSNLTCHTQSLRDQQLYLPRINRLYSLLP